MPEHLVTAEAYNELKREHARLKADYDRLFVASREIQTNGYEEGRRDARLEYLKTRSHLKQSEGDGLAHLLLPDNGGAIQFHVIGPSGPRPLTGGILSPSPDYSMRIWGPPDKSGSYGIHEQGGGNLTDFSMLFDLTPNGLVIHRLEAAGVRTRWDRDNG